MTIKTEVEFGGDWMDINGWTIYISWRDYEFRCEKDNTNAKYFDSLMDAVKHCKEN